MKRGALFFILALSAWLSACSANRTSSPSMLPQAAFQTALPQVATESVPSSAPENIVAGSGKKLGTLSADERNAILARPAVQRFLRTVHMSEDEYIFPQPGQCVNETPSEGSGIYCVQFGPPPYGNYLPVINAVDVAPTPSGSICDLDLDEPTYPEGGGGTGGAPLSVSFLPSTFSTHCGKTVGGGTVTASSTTGALGYAYYGQSQLCTPVCAAYAGTVEFVEVEPAPTATPTPTGGGGPTCAPSTPGTDTNQSSSVIGRIFLEIRISTRMVTKFSDLTTGTIHNSS